MRYWLYTIDEKHVVIVADNYEECLSFLENDDVENLIEISSRIAQILMERE